MSMGTYNGRAMLSAFGQECGGQRMMRGEQLWRTDKVIDKSTAVTAHGFTISAKVLSQDYRSGAPGGAYTTSLRFVPMSVAETNVAHGLVVSRLSSGRARWPITILLDSSPVSERTTPLHRI